MSSGYTLRWAIGSETSDKMILMSNGAGRLGVGFSSTTGLHSTLQSYGSIAHHVITSSFSAPTVDETKCLLIWTANTNVTYTLPSASACAGRHYTIAHRGSAGTVTLSASVSKGNSGNFNTLSAGEWAEIWADDSGNWTGYKLTSA